jgi:hypothetical protein
MVDVTDYSPRPCRDNEHVDPDNTGRCIRCGRLIEPDEPEPELELGF